MENRYDPQAVESRWQRWWEDNCTFEVQTEPDRDKYYVLEMFPYPSGNIHMGHVRNYAITDVIARYHMARGLNVIHPMGWDAFGMPAENAALKHNIHPAQWTWQNIDRMRDQLKRLGFSYDWSRELATCDPAYYKWEQKLFLQMLEQGLVYRKSSFVNWCPTCLTVLANEQVVGGGCWRCEQQVVQKEMPQWFFRITDYAEELLNDVEDKLQGWPEQVRTMQHNWIGKSSGAEIEFPIKGTDGERITVFTTRPDTLYGATFMSLAPEHPLVERLTTDEHRDRVQQFVQRVISESKIARTAEDYEKEGVATGAYCINPVTGWEIPIFVANFVLMEYGSGAVMAVPAHDQRDFEFARRYALPIEVVIQPPDETLHPDTMEAAYEGRGTMVNSGSFDGLDSETGKWEVVVHLDRDGLGRKAVSYRLKDWCVSRQRYWGVPIPVVFCDKCGIVGVPDEALPVELPDIEQFTMMGDSPLARVDSFVNTRCPKCSGAARRETDTMDTFVESSWYFVRYACPHEQGGMTNAADAGYWLPVDQYVGGIEHAVMHLLYARFYTKVMRDQGLVAFDEPFTRLLCQGMVIKEYGRCPEHGYLFPDEMTEEQTCGKCGQPLEVGKAKMSKSLNNIVDPEALLERYGADTVRLFALFSSPPEKELEWSDAAVEGASRFLNRLWRFLYQNIERVRDLEATSSGEDLGGLSREDSALRRVVHKTIERVTDDVGRRLNFNTAIARLMEFVNALTSHTTGDAVQSRRVLREAIESLCVMLAPFAPHIAEQFWADLGYEGGVLKAGWPTFDPEAARDETITVVIQVNGKLRSRMEVPPGASKEELEQAARADEKIQPYIEGKTIRRVIVVPNKLVNIVV